jgi:hypothetical protein
MAKVKVTKKEADRMMKVNGKVNGSLLNANFQFVLNKKGEKGIKTVEERLKELGYPLKFKEVSDFKWYPCGFSALITLAILEYFGWDESKAFEIARYGPVYSVVSKLFIKYMVSLDKILKEVPNYWQKHFDFGEMKCPKYDEKKKYAILRIYGYKKCHPLDYILIKGYLSRIFELGTGSKNVKVEQTKSLYHNDPYDEFKITWQ